MTNKDIKEILDEIEYERQRIWTTYVNGGNCEADRVYVDMGMLLNKIIEELKSKERWIPCSEKLPQFERNVLFCTKDGIVAEGVRTETKWIQFRWTAGYAPWEVIAWQPLPEPYKESE